MNNTDTQATLGTQDTERRQTKQTTQKTKKMSNTDPIRTGVKQRLAKGDPIKTGVKHRGSRRVSSSFFLQDMCRDTQSQIR